MSDDTKTATVTDSIPDAISSAVDTDEIESMLEDDSIDAVGREVGQRVGREVGARIGRELGPSVANDIRERKSPLTILRNAARRLLTILVRTVQNADLKGGISKLSDLGGRILSEGTVKDGIAGVLPSGVTDASEEDEEADEASETPEEGEVVQETEDEDGEDADATEEAEGEDEESGAVEQGEERDAEEGDTDEGGAVPDEIPEDADLSADEIQDLTEDTYRELLETMSYRELQSLAKDVGVKANLAQGEMTDRLVAEFSEEGEA